MSAKPSLQCIEDVTIYVPDLESAIAFYQDLGLVKDETCAREKVGEGRAVRLQFPGGGAGLVLHDDARRQFVDLETRVASVRETYRALSSRADINWILTPHQTTHGWAAVMRGPDRNVLVLVSED
jgi:catechol 2,3-dioxygenase-like lactoylglutathione lyase family enzyme